MVMSHSRPSSRRRTGTLVVICALLAVAGAGVLAVARPWVAAAAAPASIATPPMGWASWNSFAAQINYNVIKTQTDALVSSGMKDAGYQFVNIDEGWWQGTRDAAGNITVNNNDW